MIVGKYIALPFEYKSKKSGNIEHVIFFIPTDLKEQIVKPDNLFGVDLNYLVKDLDENI